MRCLMYNTKCNLIALFAGHEGEMLTKNFAQSLSGFLSHQSTDDFAHNLQDH